MAGALAAGVAGPHLTPVAPLSRPMDVLTRGDKREPGSLRSQGLEQVAHQLLGALYPHVQMFNAHFNYVSVLGSVEATLQKWCLMMPGRSENLAGTIFKFLSFFLPFVSSLRSRGFDRNFDPTISWFDRKGSQWCHSSANFNKFSHGDSFQPAIQTSYR